MNNLAKYLYHKLIKNQNKWFPFIAVYYLTYDCDFRCSYCSDGNSNPYYKLKSHNISAEDALKIIAKIRNYTDYFVVTGGEPLNHPEFRNVIKEISKFKFKNVVLTTNGFDVDRYLTEIAESVNSLVFSIDTLDEVKADKIFGKPTGTFKKILKNLELAKTYTHRKYDIIISSVVTPENIEDLYEVYKFAKANAFEFAACPQLEGVKAHKLLYNNKEYYNFFNFLIKEKKLQGNIYGTKKYLEYMRDLKQFSCKPFTMLVVSPNGELFYPCLEIGNLIGNIDEFQNLHKAKLIGLKKFGTQPNCGNQCHSACALTFSLLVKNI